MRNNLFEKCKADNPDHANDVSKYFTAIFSPDYTHHDHEFENYSICFKHYNPFN